MVEMHTDCSPFGKIKKSAFLIINGKKRKKRDLTLKNGTLEYKSTVTYLGAIISDTGNLIHDVDQYLKGKRSNVTVKYGTFCRKEFLAPLDIKLRISNTCTSASITYGCETWGCSNFDKIVTLYGLSITLDYLIYGQGGINVQGWKFSLNE